MKGNKDLDKDLSEYLLKNDLLNENGDFVNDIDNAKYRDEIFEVIENSIKESKRKILVKVNNKSRKKKLEQLEKKRKND